MSLNQRRAVFNNLIKYCNGNVRKINDLMIEIKIPKKFLKTLKQNTINYVSKSFNDNKKINNEDKLIMKINNKNYLIKNMTPNGLLMPKKENAEAFNNILKSYAAIIKFLGIKTLVDKFHFPPTLNFICFVLK